MSEPVLHTPLLGRPSGHAEGAIWQGQGTSGQSVARWRGLGHSRMTLGHSEMTPGLLIVETQAIWVILIIFGKTGRFGHLAAHFRGRMDLPEEKK